tara:strand:+ start:830 stop:1222 length:393 start_codon:yes stop_codon:yes gene_type:complete
MVFHVDNTITERYSRDTIKKWERLMTSVKRDVASKDGKREDGPFVTYHDNGQVAFRETYKDGKLDGPYVVYHDNGQVQYEGRYTDGKRDGLYVTYHGNGELESKGNFKNGKLDGPGVSYSYSDNIEEVKI